MGKGRREEEKRRKTGMKVWRKGKDKVRKIWHKTRMREEKKERMMRKQGWETEESKRWERMNWESRKRKREGRKECEEKRKQRRKIK